MSDLYDRLNDLIENGIIVPERSHIMSEHTAGPWQLKGTTIFGANGEVVVDLLESMSGEDTEADAHLIAAAPELLATLETLRVCLTAPLFDRDALDGMYDIVQAAIAKVRGVTS